MTELSRDETRTALYWLDAARRAHVEAGHTAPHSLTALLQRLATLHRCGAPPVEKPTSQRGVDLSGESEAWIGTGAAAKLLGMSTQAVWRRRRSLDGHQINGRWLYPIATIRDMQRHKENDQ